MLDLKQRSSKPDIRLFVKQLEQWIINTLAAFDIKGEVREGRIGVWVELPNGKEAKIAALGIRVRQWVSYHGIAINVHPDLSHYAGIIPCGISEHGVTSLHDLGVKATMQEVDSVLQSQFEKIF
jgi:lipoyl(octanoyl) transferase